MGEPYHSMQAARKAFQSRFSSEEERSAHYRNMGKKSAASRVIISKDEARAIVEAYSWLCAEPLAPTASVGVILLRPIVDRLSTLIGEE